MCCFFVFKGLFDFTGNFTYVTVAEMSPQILQKSNFHVKETLFLISLGKITVFHMNPISLFFQPFETLALFVSEGHWGEKKRDRKKKRTLCISGNKCVMEKVFGVECTVRTKEKHG